MRLDSVALCKNGLCVVQRYEVEDLPAAFDFEVPSIAHGITSKPHDVAGRRVTSRS